jgi:antitoxin (DNA-binding transcriptional repressor) of toxin-antitoxin stability system
LPTPNPLLRVDAESHAGEEVTVAKENKPVVEILLLKPVKRKSGTGKGILRAPDFDEPLDDSKEYRYFQPLDRRSRRIKASSVGNIASGNPELPS